MKTIKFIFRGGTKVFSKKEMDFENRSIFVRDQFSKLIDKKLLVPVKLAKI